MLAYLPKVFAACHAEPTDSPQPPVGIATGAGIGLRVRRSIVITHLGIRDGDH
jgi:hypothetical protein